MTARLSEQSKRVEFNLGHTFNYAEMAALIAPSPFMVERGHNDGVAPDEWVAYEYAKVRRLYDRLGIGERTAIEFFNGQHTINGIGGVTIVDGLQVERRLTRPPAVSPRAADKTWTL